MIILYNIYYSRKQDTKKKAVAITHRERTERIRERASFSFTRGRYGGRGYWIRLTLLLAATTALTWYIQQGENNPFADKRVVVVAGDASGFAVTCLTGRGGGAVAAELRVRGGGEEVIRAAADGFAFSDAYPFGDDTRAALLTYAGADALVCDTSIYAPRGDGVRSLFWERLELLIIPPAGEEAILRVREYFRPRYTVVLPPCEMTPLPGVLCGGAEFKYSFALRSGKLKLDEHSSE